ncbi:MAG: hypothetical protein GQF41_3788 [Candidatus Rifleibacterium amylolyticum]|nr:MAG: hypothetical protein GQF41_3788 [Candidatus Rifleibacterium amylolyticum]
MLPGTPAVGSEPAFAFGKPLRSQLTKKQIRFLQDAIMPDRIRTEAIWPSGLMPKFNAL